MAVASESGSLFASLFWLYMVIALLVGGLVLGWLFYSMWKFRARPGAVKPRDAPVVGALPAERGHPLWSYVMAIVIAAIMFGLAFGTISAVTTLETPPAEGDRIDIDITGFQFGWRMTYPGEGGIPVPKVGGWKIPVDTAMVADVRSQDVWHNFALPEFRVRIDVIPGETTHIWWKAKELGTVFPVCVQICGVGHAQMHTTMDIVSKDDFRVWFADETAKEYAKLERAGQVRNITYTGPGASTPPADGVDTTKAYALRITNEDTSSAQFTVGPNTVEVPPGETRYAFAPAGTEGFIAHGAARPGSVS